MAIKFEGVSSVVAKLNKVAEGDGLYKAMGKACALVEKDAKTKAPKDTGDLRRSIESKVENSGDEVVGIVFTPLEYAPYVEYGTGLYAENGGRKDVPWLYKDDEGKTHITSGQHPQPYMRPALEENRKKIIEILKKEGINLD